MEPFWKEVSHEIYCEPFAGGAAVFFNKPKAEKNILNDIDSELITTYRILQDDEMRVKLVNEITKEIANPIRWREIFNMQPKNDFEIAYKYFYLNRTSFSGKLVSAAWGYREKRSLPPTRWNERIIPCGEFLKGTELRNEDFETIISSLNENALIYVDPPYFSPPKNKHYRNGFSITDHERLAECLRKTKSKFILTYDDCSAIRNLYSWANITEVKFFYRVDNSSTLNGKRKLGFELIITNYTPKSELKL